MAFCNGQARFPWFGEEEEEAEEDEDFSDDGEEDEEFFEEAMFTDPRMRFDWPPVDPRFCMRPPGWLPFGPEEI
jgi:hypothetical protein